MTSFAFGCAFCANLYRNADGDDACRCVKIMGVHGPKWLAKDERASRSEYCCGPEGRHFKPHARYAAAKDDAA